MSMAPTRSARKRMVLRLCLSEEAFTDSWDMAPHHVGISLGDLDPLHVRNVVFEALRHGERFRADLVDHLLELVDWRHTRGVDGETLRMLRQLQDASERYELGELSLDGYRDLSVSLFFAAPIGRSRRRRYDRGEDSEG